MTGQAVVTEAAREWVTASEVQQHFMEYSRPMVDGFDYSGHCRQMDALGGDFYSFLPLENGTLALAVGDASGKGVAAALMISNVQSSLRTASLFAGDDIALTVEAVNRQLCGAALDRRFATLFYGVLDNSTGVLRYVNAGHNPPMVFRRSGAVVPLETGGAPAGIFPEWKYQEGGIELHPGDLIVAYTDGIVEAVNMAGDEWGVDGLQKTIASCRTRRVAEIVDAVFSALDEYTDGVQVDDATVAVLRVL